MIQSSTSLSAHPSPLIYTHFSLPFTPFSSTPCFSITSCRYSLGDTALHVAAKRGNDRMIALLTGTYGLVDAGLVNKAGHAYDHLRLSYMTRLSHKVRRICRLVLR